MGPIHVNSVVATELIYCIYARIYIPIFLNKIKPSRIDNRFSVTARIYIPIIS